MHLKRTLPPAAAPISPRQLVSGLCGVFCGEKALDRFQSELKAAFGAKHCFLVSSGKAALTVILLSLKDLFPGRDEVLIPAYTCYSVPSSVIRAGLRVRLCDQDAKRLDFDFRQLSTILLEKTQAEIHSSPINGDSADSVAHMSPAMESGGQPVKKLLAVVPTHLFGIPADVPRVTSMIRDPCVTVIEDAAQAMGETCGGKQLGTLGDVGVFSLARGKAFSTVEGGIILTNRDDIAGALGKVMARVPAYTAWHLLAIIFQAIVLMIFTRPSLFWIPRAIPFLRIGSALFEPKFPIMKMSSFQAGLAADWLVRLDMLRQARQDHVRKWMASRALGRDAVSLSECSEPGGLVRFPIRVTDEAKRSALLKSSDERGLGVMPGYPRSVAELPELKGWLQKEGHGCASRCARELVTLPTHGYLKPEDIKEIESLLSELSISGSGEAT